MKFLLAISLAGMAGTLCRYGITLLPWHGRLLNGTMCVNILGAFLAGFCFSWLNARHPEQAKYLPVLFVGFFGAFTTFSTFMLDTAKLLSGNSFGLAASNLLLQNALGFLCVWCGMLLGKKL